MTDFCNPAPCFAALADVLDEHPQLRRKATYRIHEFRSMTKSLRGLDNPRHKSAMLVLLRERFLENLPASWPPVVKSLTANCITTLYRIELQELEKKVRQWNRARREKSRLAGG